MFIAALLVPDFSAYRAWKCVTPQAVDMTPAIALSCVGPASWDRSPKNPHVRKRFKVWVNPVGRATLEGATYRQVREGLYEAVPSRFPAGSVIVKEKFDAAASFEEAVKWDRKPPKPLPKTPELLTIMVKGAKGSKPATGDWSYYVSDAGFRRVDSSQESRCASCHASKKEFDFTFRGYGLPTH